MISLGHFKDQLSKKYKSYTLFYNSKDHYGCAKFHYIKTIYHDVILPTIYKKRLSYIPVIKPDNNYQVYTMSQLMKDPL